MAKMLIQGTDGGYKVFYPIEIGNSPFNPLTKDERSLFYTKNWLFYSVAMVGNGCILSTYRYVQERRNDGTDGYVAFSFFLPYDSLIKKGEAKALLDELSKAFFNKYVDIEDNNRLSQVSVSGCLYLESILDKYHFCGSNPLLNQHQEKVSYAFVICDDEKEVGDYLNNPFQNEYEPYKQVFFVEKRYRNCLLLPDTANLTGKIDLENPRYKLIIPHSYSGLNVEVKINDKKQYNDNKVYRKDKLTITYSKKYCNSIFVEGRTNDESIRPYLEIDEDSKRITVKQDIELMPASKKITIIAKDNKGKFVQDVDVKVSHQGNNSMIKTPESDGSYIFTGEELGESYSVTASNHGLSGSKNFVPDQIEGTELFLTIQKQKVVNFIIKNNWDVLFDCNITVEEKESHLAKKTKTKDKLTYEFSGDEIEKEYIVTVSKYKHKTESVVFCPKNENSSTKYIELKRQEDIGGTQERRRTPSKQKYYLEIDSYKGDRGNCPDYINNVSDIDEYCPDVKKGYKFVKWEDHTDQPYNQCDGHFLAIFEETWWHKYKGTVLLIGSGIAIFAVLAWVVVKFIFDNTKHPVTTEYAFINVVDSIKSCSNDTCLLIALQERWEKHMPMIEKEGGFLGIGGTPDSTNYKAWEDGLDKIRSAINEVSKKTESANNLKKEISNYVYGDELFLEKLKEYRKKCTDETLISRLDSCIQLREWLNKGKISEIKKNSGFNYSTLQQPLKKAINSISSKAINHVGLAMRQASISTMSLNEIVSFINIKVKEMEGNDIITTTTPSTTSQTTTVDNLKQLELKFWELVHGKGKKNEFDELFKESGWNHNSNIWIFYNRYLSWGTQGDNKKKSGEDKYNYYKGFYRVRTIDLASCNDINQLTNLVKKELGL